ALDAADRVAAARAAADRDSAVRDTLAAATTADPQQTWPPESDRYQNTSASFLTRGEKSTGRRWTGRRAVTRRRRDVWFDLMNPLLSAEPRPKDRSEHVKGLCLGDGRRRRGQSSQGGESLYMFVLHLCKSGAYDVPITEEGTKKVAILGH
ncbi:hypothetical protein THAOC_29478, partial [Thalassiosira oceanica]